jgi:phage terminase large subunit-like protein
LALEPFTVPHFAAWAARIVLDNGQNWVLEPFQADFLADVFAGRREAWLLVAEGNGKTTLTAGLALYHAQHRQSGLVAVAAASRDQALVLYNQALGFIDRTSWMQKVFKVQPGHRRILCEGPGSTVQVFSADEKTGDGIIPTLCILDELHRHDNLRLLRVWSGKLDKRGGQMVVISTAGEPGSEFEETRSRLHDQAEELETHRCYTRAVTQDVVLHDWAVPPDGKVDDIELVKAANPFSGVTVEQLARKRQSPTMTEAHFRRFNCNLPTRSEQTAISEAEWAAARSAETIPAGQPIAVGLDVAWKYDTTALVPLWYKDKEHRILGEAEILVPPRDGTNLDPHLVEGAIRRMHQRNPIATVVMDPTRAEQLAAWITEEIGARVVERVQQPAALAQDYERFTEALRQGWLKHTGHPGLARQVLNAIAKIAPNGRTVFERPSHSREPSLQAMRCIDALSAAAMVNAVMAGEDVRTEPEILIAFR